MHTKVSVIITTWNRAELLRHAVQSVLKQTFNDFELLILDNRSTDDTEKVACSFSDMRIRYIRHKPLGISGARNLGVKEARGEFIGFLDDDDEWLPEKLAKQVALFGRSLSDVGMVYGGFNRVTEDGSVYEVFVPTLRGNALIGYLCGRNPLTGSASNPLIRKEVFGAVGGYDETLKTSEDWEFYLRLMRKFKVDFVREPIVNIRRHSGVRLGDRFLDAAAAELRVVEEFKDVLEAHPRCLSRYLQTIGGKYCRAGEAKKGREYLGEAISRSPLNFTAYGQYVLSFLGTKFYAKAHAFYKNIR